MDRKVIGAWHWAEKTETRNDLACLPNMYANDSLTKIVWGYRYGPRHLLLAGRDSNRLNAPTSHAFVWHEMSFAVAVLNSNKTLLVLNRRARTSVYGDNSGYSELFIREKRCLN